MKNNLFSLVRILGITLVFGVMVTGCASLFGGGGGGPASFVTGATGGETSVLLRPGLEYEQAFREVIFVLTRHGFHPEMINQDAGFIRTQWNHEWHRVAGRDGVDRYRVRAIVNFNPARDQLIINPEGEWYQNGAWVRGFDRRAAETLRNDLTMAVGN